MTTTGAERDATGSARDVPAGDTLAGTTVLFDWNGTLVDDRPRAWAAARAIIATLQPELGRPSDAGLEAAWRGPVQAFFVDLGVRPDRAVTAERMWNVEMALEPPSLRSGARELLHDLRRHGARIGIVSAGLPSLLVRDLDGAHLAGAVDVLLAGVTDKGAALRSLAGAGPLVYIGDSEADMEAARTVGAIPVGIAGGYQPASALAAAGAVGVLTRLDDLWPMIGAEPTSES